MAGICTVAAVFFGGVLAQADPDGEPRFRRGDVDGNAAVELTDPVFLIKHLFLGSPGPSCPDAADWDDDGALDISDAIMNLNYQFLGAFPSAAPGPLACGEDPTADTLGACTASGCP